MLSKRTVYVCQVLVLKGCFEHQRGRMKAGESARGCYTENIIIIFIFMDLRYKPNMDKETALSLSTMRSNDKEVELIVHINESLDEERRKGLVESISKDSGIVSVEFTPLRHHLMRVRYDRQAVQSMDILQKIKRQNVNAQLVGPI